jgi:lipopolysaccharide export system protein LptA
MKNYWLLLVIFSFAFIIGVAASNKQVPPEAFIPPPGSFDEPKGPPTTVINANRLYMKDKRATLEGDVKMTRENETLTCGKAFVSETPRWLLASISPQIYRKERIEERKIVQEMNLEAKNIYANDDEGRISASPSVHLRVEERSFDLASHTWATITSDDMLAFRESDRAIFSGHVKFRDPDSFGSGNRLDYARRLGLVVISGNAYLETKEINAETGEKETRILRGKIITYNTETREAVSE